MGCCLSPGASLMVTVFWTLALFVVAAIVYFGYLVLNQKVNRDIEISRQNVERRKLEATERRKQDAERQKVLGPDEKSGSNGEEG